MATPKPVLKVLPLNTETLPSLISVGSENISKERKERWKAVPTFPSIFKRFFLKTLTMFFIAKRIFFIIRSTKNIIIKKFWPKIRTGDIVVAVFVLYRCAVDASTLHDARHGTTRLRRRPTFSIFFFRRKAGALGQKKKYVSNEIN